MTYADEELIYAAHARCRCGAGYAHPNDGNARGSWACSAVLRGKAKQGPDHDDPKPFTFWEIKSERQPSQRGATTRPGGPIDAERLRAPRSA